MEKEPRSSAQEAMTTHEQPGSNRLGEAVAVAQAFLQHYDRPDRDTRPVQLFRALVDLTRAKHDAGALESSHYEFSRDELIGEMPDTGGIDAHGNINSWWRKLERWQSNQVNGLIKDAAQDLGYQVVPVAHRLASKGGPRNQTTYRLIAESSGEQESPATQAIPSGCIRYERASEQIHNSWVSVLGSELGRTKLLAWLIACLVVAVLAGVCLALAIVSAINGVSGGVLAGGMYALLLGGLGWYWLAPIVLTVNNVVAQASVWHTPWSESDPMQIVLERDEATDARRIALRKYESKCGVPNCGGEVMVGRGTGDMKGRLIGRCRRSPNEHIYTFDHQTRTGFPLRTAASWHAHTRPE
ncbi:hypothetical protein J7355_15620 [Endozoicomonas sp. G2_2]|uniref:hypothetical protein n=1 Tax=Endozoicomonas sp. G2_2 TaxID=2821092 RepID=UPI001ADD08CB|nr:hypothetical protein [Endozoicomonas sp. G2_2]MBO9471518.1 hypothetical protein [Endozoicomonas sp. G2_2]